MPDSTQHSLKAPAFLSAKLSLILLSVVAFAFCLWVLLLPLFPTQDGPMHLYYVRILRGLLFHDQPGIFPNFYTIKSLLPPYSLYYYLLLALYHFVPLMVADKLVICLYFLSFLFGFRFFLSAIGPYGNTMALLAAPLLINWPLGMGFVNFCLSLTLGFWALGFWSTVAQKPNQPRNVLRLAGFVVLCYLMMLTHPVPLALVLGFCFVELMVRLWQKSRRVAYALRIRPAAIALLCASTTMIYVRIFVHSNSMQQHEDYNYEVVRENAKIFGKLRTLIPFAGHTLADVVCRTGVVLLVLLPLILFFFDRRHSPKATNYASTLAAVWLVLCFALIIVLPILPPDFNNSHFFSARLVLVIWLAALAAASGIQRPYLSKVLAGFSMSLSAFVLILAIIRINPIARQIAELETMPLPIHSSVALMLQSPSYETFLPELSFEPFHWGPTRLLRRSESVLYDTPWLDLAIIPIGAQPNMPTGKIDSYDLESQLELRPAMLQSEAVRKMLFGPVDTVLINRGRQPYTGILDPLLAADPIPGHIWICHPEPTLDLCQLQAPR